MSTPISNGNKGIAALTNALRTDMRGRQDATNTEPGANARAARSDEVSISAAARFQQQAEGPRGSGRLSAATAGATQQPGSDRIGSDNANRGERMKALMSDMRASFYSSSGDDNFDRRLDFNRDGSINAGDLAMVREKMAGRRQHAMTQPAALPSQDQTQPGMNPRAMMEGMRDAFFSRAGDDNFNAELDMNSDGVINAQDLGDLRRRMASTPASALSPATAATPSQEQTQPIAPNRAMMDSMRDAFFSRAGDDNFNAELDFNSDGVINAQDLGDLRQRMEAAATSALSAAAPPSQDQTQTMTTSGSATTGAVTSDGATSIMDQLRSAFFTSAGEDGFNADVDFNGDGVINTEDLGLARQREQQPTDPVYPNVETPTAAAQSLQSASAAEMQNPVAPQPVQENNTGPITSGGETQQTNATADARAALVEKLRDAFYSSTGDENFLAALDSNGDGQINAADLAAMRARFEADGNDIA